MFGYEGVAFEAWAYPLKLLDDFRLSFRLEGYPLDIDGTDVPPRIDVRPEATVFTYAHAAFTVRQIIFAPVDEPGDRDAARRRQRAAADRHRLVPAAPEADVARGPDDGRPSGGTRRRTSTTITEETTSLRGVSWAPRARATYR